METTSVWQEIGIDVQHLGETAVPGRFQLICDKSWLQSLQQRRRIGPFPRYAQLSSRAHPAGPLEHPWTRILVQNYRKQPRLKVFALPPRHSVDATRSTASDCMAKGGGGDGGDISAVPLTYSQAVAHVANANFRNLWEAAHKRYPAAHVKFCKPSTGVGAGGGSGAPACHMLPYDSVLKELIQRIFQCPVIHAHLDRVRNDVESQGLDEDAGKAAMTNDDGECHAILPGLVAIETSTHISVFFYPPLVATSLHDCITYSPAVLSKSYNKPLFLIYQIFQLSKAMQAAGLFLGDVRLHDLLVRDNLWMQVLPRLEANMLHPTSSVVEEALSSTPSEAAAPELIQTEPTVDNVADECDVVVDGDDDDEYTRSSKLDLKFAYDLEQFTLREYCELWCSGQLSNFDYLTVLNNAAGRSLSNPAYHHIMPWVSDLAMRSGGNWRDLSRSKYRLNKGDLHLDLMFAHVMCQTSSGSAAGGSVACGGAGGALGKRDAQDTVPHHVSDFLSEITFFVYTARRTPQHILREHVRKVWVPAEYPVSIQRLQEWTPDECIPEFYSDPMIFKSIHEDLPDLEVPGWATCPEDFIFKHREALESHYVSERLQHWIDLNFGYKLSGKAAIKSKNVCLSMVDQHKTLCQRGIVQLFTQPHPPKRFPSPWFNRTAPRLSQLGGLPPNQRRHSPRSSSRHHHNNSSDSSKRLQPDESQRRLGRSTENLSTAPPSTAGDSSATDASSRGSPRLSLRPSLRDDSSESLASTGAVCNASFYSMTTNFIELPKDYNPSTLLQSLETQQIFMARTFPRQQRRSTLTAQERMAHSDLLFEEHSAEHSFTNQLFVDDAHTHTSATVAAGHGKSVPRAGKSLLAVPAVHHAKRRTLKQLLAEKRESELHVVGCLIVELVAMPRLRPLLMSGVGATLEQRLHACRTVVELHRADIPKCLRHVVRLLLQLEEPGASSSHGLPPLTPAQLLEPIFANFLVPFPSHYYPTYALVRSLHAFDFAATLLELQTHFNCNGRDCAQYTEVDRTRVLFERKLAECKVMSCCAHIGRLLEPVAYEQFRCVELLLPHVVDLLSDEQTSILTAWNLFDPMAQALGVAQTQKHLLLPIMKLYDVESFERGMISVRTQPTDTAGSGADGGGVGQLRFSQSSSFKSRKSVKLYHHSFLLRLIVRFGLRCFLQNFIAPLIEAVGGYKEPEDGNGLHYHSANTTTHATASRRTSKNLRYGDGVNDEEDDVSLTLRPRELLADALERVADATLDVDVPPNGAVNFSKQEIEEVFSFDDDANSDLNSNTGTAENKSLDSFDLRAAPAEEAKEESTPEKLAISEIIYGSKISISNASLDESGDKLSLRSSQLTPSDSPTAIAPSTQLGPKSPTIEIPAAAATSAFHRSYQLNAIDCDVGSRKSVDSFDIIAQAVEEEEAAAAVAATAAAKLNAAATEPERQAEEAVRQQEASDSLQASVISRMSEAKALQNNRISEMSAESLVWLSHRLGPVLTSRFITRNLLKMLSLCYVGQENLLPEAMGGLVHQSAEEASSLNYFSIADARVVGDRSAARVLDCLMSIAALFGEEIILLQYFPHISELIALGTKRLTGSLEGAIISTLQLLKYLVPCLLDATIMERLKDMILESIVLPILRLLSSTRILMPSGYLGRSVLARKLLDALYALCVRIGPDMSKEHLCAPALRPFFLIFDKAYGIAEQYEGVDFSAVISPPTDERAFAQRRREVEELRDVFGPALAHTAYLAFLRFLGEAIVQRTLLNLDFILTLCHEFEQPDYYKSDSDDNGAVDASHRLSATAGAATDAVDCPLASGARFAADESSSMANSFGTQVIGNRIEVTSPTAPQAVIGPMEVLDMVAYKFEHVPTTRHLRGNWLAYWRHEISRPDKDTILNLKQIKLQSYVGHTNSVRAIVTLDNENSFISASKDKTVKLWSLRSEGDGTKATSCQFTYTAHKKSIHSLAFLESMRFVVSCDAGIHIWDPFIGRPLGVLDSPKHNAITVVRCLPSPSPLIVAGTAESTVKIVDARCMQYVNEWRVSGAGQSNATVRCLTVAPSGNWLAVGLSSGGITMLDTRTGVLLNSWRPIECDLLQLTAPNDQQLISSAVDHSLAVWHANDGILHYQLKPPAEPAHYLQTIGSELIFATTANRIGLYSDIGSSHAAYSVTKLRSETFRGVLTSLAVLPLNRAFLAGNESGNIVLLC